VSDRGPYHRRKKGWSPTAAQARVLDALAEGMTNAEIAVRLGLSPETVKWHISALLSLTGAMDREELAKWWRRRSPAVYVIPRWQRYWPFTAAAVVSVLAVLGLAIAGGNGLDRPSSATATPALNLAIPLPQATLPVSEGEWNACPTDRGKDDSENTGLSPVDPTDFVSQGLVPVGRFIDPQSCTLLSANRAALSFFRVPMSATILGDDLTGVAVRRVWHLEEAVKVSGVEVRLSISSTGTTYSGPGAEFIVSAVDSISGVHRTAVDQYGQVWVDAKPLADSTVVDSATGEGIDASTATRLGRLQPNGRPQAFAQPVFYFTGCYNYERSISCYVSYRPFAPTIAPVAGIVSCPAEDRLAHDQHGHLTGVVELDAGSFKLRFTELFTYTANSKDSFSCATRRVNAGEPIGDHYHYSIEAFRPDGTPLSVMVSQDSTLFVGDVKQDFACPCEPGN
jgi:DNA-binding CsgD family transcriptional regulator